MHFNQERTALETEGGKWDQSWNNSSWKRSQERRKTTL